MNDQVHAPGAQGPKRGRRQARGDELRELGAIPGVVFPVHPGCSRVQHWAAVPEAHVDKR